MNRGNLEALKHVARDRIFQEKKLRIQSSEKHLRGKWKLHELLGLKVVSLRAAPIYMSHTTSPTGSNLVAHALVRIHSTQVSHLIL
jgi:hypothetical protein